MAILKHISCSISKKELLLLLLMEKSCSKLEDIHSDINYFLYRADIDSADSQTKHQKSIWNGCKSALKIRLCEKLLAHDLASSFFWICNPCIQTQICNPCLMPNQHLFAARIVVDWSRQMKELKRKPSSCYRHDNPPERQIPRMTTNFQWTFSKSIFKQTQTTPHQHTSIGKKKKVVNFASTDLI